MTVSININAETAVEAVQAILDLAHNFGKNASASAAINAAPVAAAPVPANDTGPVEPVVEKKTRGKAKDKAPETIEGTATVTGEVPMLTIDDARERVRAFNAAGHMDQGLEALAHFGAKKLSEVDPDAGGKPSVKYAELVAKIEELIAAKG